MRAVVFQGSSRVETQDIPMPVPGPGEVLLRVRASALCGSELKSYRSPTGSASNGGHEIAGEIADANHTDLRAGDRVVVNIMVGCGRCYHCLSGDPKFCRDLNLKTGGHAEYIVVAASACLPLPADIPFDTGVLLGGDFVGTGYRATRRLGVTATDTALVIGAGPVGLGLTSILRFLGLRVLVSEPTAYRRQLVSQLGTVTLDPAVTDVVAAAQELTAGLGPHVVFDCAGRPESENLALDAVRVKGKVGFVGENSAVTINPSKQIIHKELTVVGSWYFTSTDYYDILALYRQGYRADNLVTHRFSIEQADDAYRMFAAGETGKVLFIYD